MRGVASHSFAIKDSQTDGKKDLLNQIQTENDRLSKARKLLLDDAIDSGDYKLIKIECETMLLSVEGKLTGFSEKSYDLSDCVDKALTNLQGCKSLTVKPIQPKNGLLLVRYIRKKCVLTG